MEISWDECGQAGWEYLSNRARAPMQQRWRYGEVHQVLGGMVLRAVVCQNGDPVALCQCLLRTFGGVFHVSLASNGPVWLNDCDKVAVLKLIRSTLPVWHPRIQIFTLPAPLKSPRLIPLMTPATRAILPLPIAKTALHGKWRNALVKAQNSGLRSRHIACPPKTLLDVLQSDHQQQSSKSYRTLPAEFTLEWHRISPDDLRLITVSKAGETIATALFIRHGNTATYHIAHTSQTGRKLSAQRLALWRAFTDFARQGIEQIDLGQIDSVNAAGLTRFKLGTGARAHRLGPTVLAI